MSNYNRTKSLLLLLMLTLNTADSKNFFNNFKPIRRNFSNLKKKTMEPIKKIIQPIKTKIIEPIGKGIRFLLSSLGHSPRKFPLWLKEQDLEKVWDPNAYDGETRDQKVLRLHNEVRKVYAVQPLKWNKNLASMAEKSAGKCSGAYDYAYDHSTVKYGQNIYAVVNAKASVLAAVRTWQRSGVSYNKEAKRCEEGKNCYPFMQMIWPNSSNIGCSYSLCERLRPTTQAGSFFVCFYSPL